jgi:hypothetical protein
MAGLWALTVWTLTGFSITVLCLLVFAGDCGRDFVNKFVRRCLFGVRIFGVRLVFFLNGFTGVLLVTQILKWRRVVDKMDLGKISTAQKLGVDWCRLESQLFRAQRDFWICLMLFVLWLLVWRVLALSEEVFMTCL